MFDIYQGKWTIVSWLFKCMANFNPYQKWNGTSESLHIYHSLYCIVIVLLLLATAISLVVQFSNFYIVLCIYFHKCRLFYVPFNLISFINKIITDVTWKKLLMNERIFAINLLEMRSIRLEITNAFNYSLTIEKNTEKSK